MERSSQRQKTWHPYRGGLAKLPTELSCGTTCAGHCNSGPAKEFEPSAAGLEAPGKIMTKFNITRYRVALSD